MWITDSCDQNHTSFGSTPTPQSPENSMGAEVPTMSTFTAQYSQSGHFGLLLVSQGREREFWHKLLTATLHTCTCIALFPGSHVGEDHTQEPGNKASTCSTCSFMSFFIHTQDLNDGPLPPVYGAVLQSFSYVGLVISLVCLTAFLVTHLASR